MTVSVGQMVTVRCNYGDQRLTNVTCVDAGPAAPVFDRYISCSPPDNGTGGGDECPEFEIICHAPLSVCRNNSACAIALSGAETGLCDNVDTMIQCWNVFNTTSTYGQPEFSQVYECHENCTAQQPRYCYLPPYSALESAVIKSHDSISVPVGQTVIVRCMYGDERMTNVTCMDAGPAAPTFD
eukprot:110683_1